MCIVIVHLLIKYPLKQVFRLCLPNVSNYYCACGEKAGKSLLGNRDVTIIPNAIDVKKFYFNADVRRYKRAELGFYS